MLGGPKKKHPRDASSDYRPGFMLLRITTSRLLGWERILTRAARPEETTSCQYLLGRSPHNQSNNHRMTHAYRHR